MHLKGLLAHVLNEMSYVRHSLVSCIRASIAHENEFGPDLKHRLHARDIGLPVARAPYHRSLFRVYLLL